MKLPHISFLVFYFCLAIFFGLILILSAGKTTVYPVYADVITVREVPAHRDGKVYYAANTYVLVKYTNGYQ